MPSFSLTTKWEIPAAIENVWFAILDTEQWPNWWQFVRKVEQITPGDSTGINSIHRYFWKTYLPYQLIFELKVTQLIPYQLIAVNVSGDLTGNGSCMFSVNNQSTSILFDWNVKTCKHWMNHFPTIWKPIFAWNHQQVMNRGETSLISRLSQY